MSDDLTNAIDAWLAAGADSQPDDYAVDATMRKMMGRSADSTPPEPPANVRIHGFRRVLDELNSEIAKRLEFEAQIIRIMALTGMSYDEAVDYLKRRGE